MDLHERTLHLLDVEYLGGGWLHSGDGLALVLQRYRDTVGWRDGDHRFTDVSFTLAA